MACEGIKKLLTKYVQHTADEEEIRKVEEHLCVCHDCRSSLGKLMDELDESGKKQESKNSEKEEEKDDDFEIISSESAPGQSLEEPQKDQGQEEKLREEKAAKEPEETKQAESKPEEAQEKKESQEEKQPAEKEQREEGEEEKVQDQISGQEKEEDKETQEKDESKEDVEYFPAEGIKTFSENEPKVEEDKKESFQEKKAEEEAIESQDSSIRSGLDSLPGDQSERQELEREEEFQPAPEDKRKESATMRQDTNILPLEEGPGIIAYVSIVIGALVLVILIFLLMQG